MLSRSPCVYRTLGRSLSAANQVYNLRILPNLSGRSLCSQTVYRKSQPAFLLVPSSSYHCRYFRTSAAYRDELVTINTPPFAESITEGDVRWEKAVGDLVAQDEVVCEVETDKTSIQVPTPVAGVIEELLVPDGGRVETGTPLFKLRKTAAPAADAAPSPSTEDVAHPPPPPQPSTSAASFQPPPQPDSAPPAAVVEPVHVAPAPPAAGIRGESRERMSRMRLRIAQRLKEAQNTCAMLTTFNEVDMSNIKEMRKLYKEAFLQKHNVKLGFMSAFAKAASHALMDQPAVNAVIDDTSKEIIYRDYVDISIAVATPKGLVVPVLRNVEAMNFAGIEKAINLLGEKARKNELSVEDMDGGTFTISNGGVFGSLFGTPIINPPQSAILGMHGIFDRPVAVDGKVEVRPMMYVALTYDHRLIDGREAVKFLRKIKEVVEDPRLLFLDM
ncbi:dihydrolipoyllysine-residue succinyltransferase component of 2-oxoglutarate dehydrogenase complex, mitochondrial-like isoform X2 [Cyprinodon tularosa]|uniref:dihydrolipoyllysine-residue succinyltransferase component of 2-oxoglutarate dehydrogenase complex, mitochondrial-like isoform X2 n=1 Tax=Cyprinodon tularosa TaxID=77115 RepID=UPI0018E2463C|nr:dihydrolipoyllysine-residue succinyltransferase component of 2-oxoglutarate dehydrogenase complex, mitochondrial-like isoform X2 [Cyprinodon tularosa]